MDVSKKQVAIVSGIVAAAIVATAALIYVLTLPSVGTIIGFGVSASISSVNWGEVIAGQSKQVSFTITNVGDKAGAVTMTTSGMPAYLSLTWDSEGAILQPQQTKTVTLTLTAATTAPKGAFSFNIIITLTG